MSKDEVMRALIAVGVPKAKAARLAESRSLPPAVQTAEYMRVIGEPLTFPIRLVVPWSALVSENRRFCAVESRIRETKEYRAAKQRVASVAQRAMTAKDGLLYQPLSVPLSLVARVWFPDNRVHDAPNFAGATHNALKGIVYEDDRWLYRATWERVGVDVDAPRAEIEIAPV